MIRMRKMISLIFAVAVLIGLVGVSPLHAQDISFSNMAIIEQNVAQFPDISLYVRVQDEKGLAVQEMAAPNFSLDDPLKNLSVTTVDAPLNVAFIVDLSEMSEEELNGIQDVLATIAADYQQSNDRFHIVTIQGNGAQTVQADLAAFARQIRYNGFANARDYTDAIAQANSLLHDALTRGENAQIVFVAAYTPQTLNTPPTTVPIHTIHIQSANVQRGGAFATLTTGYYLRYQGDHSRLLEYLDRVFTYNRTIYELRYRSQSGDNATRNVTVQVNVNGETLVDQFSYQVALQPPVVTLVSEAGFEIARNAVPEEGPEGERGGYNWDTYQTTFMAEVSFPDGYPREVTAAELLVEQISLNRLDTPGERFALTWNLEPYVHPGGRVYDVSAVVEDELGLIGLSPVRSTTILVNIPEGIAVVDPCIGTDGVRLNTVECGVAENAELAIGSLIALTVGIAVLLGIVIWQRRQISGLAAGAVKHAHDSVIHLSNTILETGSQLKTRIEQSILGPQSPSDPHLDGYASFYIEEGPGAGSSIPMKHERIVFGREPDAGVDHVFPLQNISGKHCSVHYYPDERVFKIIDHRSANKTRVNGRPLEPEMPTLLPPGAEIQMARQNRVMLTFHPTSSYLNMAGDTFFPDRGITHLEESDGNSRGGNFREIPNNPDPDDDYEELDATNTQIKMAKQQLHNAPPQRAPFKHKPLPRTDNSNSNNNTSDDF